MVQLLDVKNQSSLSNRGEGCLLDHVNSLPWRVISVRSKELIASLKSSNFSQVPSWLVSVLRLPYQIKITYY